MTGNPDVAESLRARLQADLRVAMKRRDTLEIATLRCLIAAIDNAGAVALPENSEGSRNWSTASHHVVTGAGPTEVARRTLSGPDLAALLHAEWAARETAAITLERHGRAAHAERAEMAIIERYLL